MSKIRSWKFLSLIAISAIFFASCEGSIYNMYGEATDCECRYDYRWKGSDGNWHEENYKETFYNVEGECSSLNNKEVPGYNGKVRYYSCSEI